MERKRIYLCLAHMSEDGMEQKYVKEAFDTNWVVPLGPNVNGFEKDLEDFVNSLSPALPKREGGIVEQKGGGPFKWDGGGASGTAELWGEAWG